MFKLVSGQVNLDILPMHVSIFRRVKEIVTGKGFFPDCSEIKFPKNIVMNES